MAKTATGIFDVARGLSLPVDFVTSTQVIVAKKGAGKSYTASVQAEQLLEHNQQVIVIDPTGAWWGLRSSATGKRKGFPIAVFGGDHGDVPLEKETGQVIAEAAVAEGFSAVLDLSLFRKGELRRFMEAFLGALYHKNREAMHLFIDEADLIAPQRPMGEDARVLGAMEDIVRRGRIKGIGCTMITQRPAVLNKNVLTQADMLTCLRLTHQLDLKAIGDWVAVQGESDQWKTMQATLPSLPIGTAWFWNPAQDLFVKAKVNKRTTFDSGATPTPGERKIEPRQLATVDVKKLGKAIAATVERAKENDPDTLRDRIEELEAEVAGLESDEDETPGTVDVEVPVMDEDDRAALAELQVDFRYLRDTAHDLHEYAKTKFSDLEVFAETVERHLNITAERSNDARAPAPFKPTPIVAKAAAKSSGNGKFKSNAGKGRMLNALAAGGNELKREVMAIWSRMSPTSGTFTKYLSELKRDGYLTVEGGHVVLTTSGIMLAPDDGITREILQQQWAAKFGSGGKGRIFAVLLKYRAGVARGQLALLASLESSSGTFTKYLSEVRKKGILIGNKHLRLHPALWMERE